MSGLKWSTMAQTYATCLIAALILQSSQTFAKDPDSSETGYKWVSQDVRQGVPPEAVEGGYDNSSSTIYVGRAYHNGDLIPAKVIPDEKAAYVPYNGGEYVKYDIEVLVETEGRFVWEGASNGYVPPNAVVGGHTVRGETLYIGRCDHRGSRTIGKVHPSQKRLYLPYGGYEVSTASYEVLVHYDNN